MDDPTEALNPADPNPSTDAPPQQTPAPADPVLAVPTAKETTSRDYDAELASKDLAIKKLTEDWQTAKNSHHMSQAEIRNAQVALANAVQERQRIEQEKDQQLAKLGEEFETVSQATQTLAQEKTDLSSKLSDAAARATKLEVITEEFPELLRYAKLIPASEDAATVRAACQALAEARTNDLEAQRISAITGNPATQLSSQPARTEPTFADQKQLREHLLEAKNDPQEYERRRQTLIARIESAAQRAQQP